MYPPFYLMCSVSVSVSVSVHVSVSVCVSVSVSVSVSVAVSVSVSHQFAQGGTLWLIEVSKYTVHCSAFCWERNKSNFPVDLTLKVWPEVWVRVPPQAVTSILTGSSTISFPFSLAFFPRSGLTSYNSLHDRRYSYNSTERCHTVKIFHLHECVSYICIDRFKKIVFLMQ